MCVLWDSYAAGAAQLAEWVADGSIKRREHVLEGIGRAPKPSSASSSGDHLGKLAIKVV